MILLTKAQKTQLLKNGKHNRDTDLKPVVKFFNPCGAATWLFTELDEDQDTLYGLCDLGMGSPELGYASLKELVSLQLPAGLKIERDRWFKAKKTLLEYAQEATEKGYLQA